ncbi:MAG: transglutaminase domain-containing protein [Thermodesulfovibrionales bacterium]|nr:transglutaminase domain-containing protein [Thermodesulfovibrionales bacterium]
MDFRNTHACKIMSVIILFFFCWSFAGLRDVAWAATNPDSMRTIKKTSPSNINKKSTAAGMQKSMEDVRSALKDERLSYKKQKARVKELYRQIKDYDKALRLEFSQTRARLVDKGLSAKILKRHDRFVERYEKKSSKFDEHLTGLYKARTKSGFKKRSKDALAFIKKHEPPSRHVPLDPNKLPHRAAKDKKTPTGEWVAPKPMKLKPRTEHHPLVKDAPYASLYEPFNGYPVEPILIASNGSLSGLTAGSISQGTAPSTEDLAETIDIKFTPAIMAKAAELASTPQTQSGALPIAIYEWVRNNVEYVPTWGSIQGADHCLATMKCNSFDTSSLLIALFRANGIHARYVTLTGEISIEKFMNSMGGFTDAQAALDFAATGGMPVTGLVEAGKIKYVRFEQVIVEGWVDMIPSFGAKHRQGDTWIRFDPSMKGYTYTQGMDISEAVPFDAEGLVEDIVASAIINETDGSVTGMDSSIINSAMSNYRAQVEQYMASNNPDATVGDVLGTKKIMKHEFPVLMGTLVYKTKAVHSRYREIPDSLRHKITFSVAPTSSNYYVAPFSITKSLPEIAGKKITLSYSPATQADEDVINSYLPTPHADGTPIEPSELPTSLPAYLINLKPELRIDGNVVATGGSLTMGSAENMKMTFHDPVRSDDIVSNIIEAGEYWGIAVDVSAISKQQMETVKSRMETTKAKLEAEDFTGLTTEDIFGDKLFLVISYYYAWLDYIDTQNENKFGINSIRFPSEGIFKHKIISEYSFGTPIFSKSKGYVMDVDRNVSLVKGISGNSKDRLNYLRTSGIISSALEHLTVERFLGKESISAVKALTLANDSGIPVYAINSENIEVVDSLEISTEEKEDMLNFINSGNLVIASKSKVDSYEYSGMGYIVYNPNSGNGAYLITGNENGSTTVRETTEILIETIDSEILGPIFSLSQRGAIAKESIYALLKKYPNFADDVNDKFNQWAVGFYEKIIGKADQWAVKIHPVTRIEWAAIFLLELEGKLKELVWDYK